MRSAPSLVLGLFKSGFSAGRFHDFSPPSTVCLGPSEAAGGQDSSQLAP